MVSNSQVPEIGYKINKDGFYWPEKDGWQLERRCELYEGRPFYDFPFAFEVGTLPRHYGGGQILHVHIGAKLSDKGTRREMRIGTTVNSMTFFNRGHTLRLFAGDATREESGIEKKISKDEKILFIHADLTLSYGTQEYAWSDDGSEIELELLSPQNPLGGRIITGDDGLTVGRPSAQQSSQIRPQPTQQMQTKVQAPKTTPIPQTSQRPAALAQAKASVTTTKARAYPDNIIELIKTAYYTQIFHMQPDSSPNLSGTAFDQLNNVIWIGTSFRCRNARFCLC